MVGFNIMMFVFSTYLCLSKVLECNSLSSRIRCPTMRLNNGRVREQSRGRSVRITCFTPFKLVRGNQIATCVQGKWDTESPICARTGCEIVENIPHGKLEILYQGAKLEVKCDVGYTIDGPTFVYCNEELEWNEELIGCKEHDQIYLSCDFESSDDRFCGWKNDGLNIIDWFADNMLTRKYILLYTRHVAPGPSEYFRSNYISLNTGTYGYNTTGRLISPQLLPVSSKQRCLIFAYKVTSGIPNSISELKVIFGGIPHWETQEGEGRVIIGLYQLNYTSEIVIQGTNCKAAIDNIFVTEGNSCNERPNEETDSCHDNCGKITDRRCSCDWECYNNNNCCSDIQIKCPYIKPLADIEKLYLTISTTATPTVLKTTAKIETLNITAFNVTPSTPIINTPKNGRNDSIDQVTTMSTVKSLNITTTTFAPETMKNSTTMAESIILNTTTTEFPKSRLVINSTIPLSINPYSVTTSMIPKSSMNILVMDIQSNSSKTTSLTTLPKTASSTTDHSIIKMTSSTEKLNITPTSIPKSSIGKTVSTISTLSNTTSNFRPDKVNLTIPEISIPSVIITKPVVENSSLATSTSIYFSSSTVSSKLSTKILINSSSTPTKLFTENSSSTPTPINNTTKISIKPSISNNAPYMMTSPKTTSLTIKPLTINITSFRETLNIKPTVITKKMMENTITTTTTLANISSSVEQLSNKSLNTQHTTQKINENKPTLNNSTTRIPNSLEYLNVSTVHKNKMVVIDTFLPNLDLKPSEYNQSINNINIPNVQSSPPNEIELKNKTPTTYHENLEFKNSLNYHSVPNGSWFSDSGEKTENHKFGIVTIILFIASISAVLITIKYTYSRMVLHFNKPINDAICEPFVGTDDDSYCEIELTSKRKE